MNTVTNFVTTLILHRLDWYFILCFSLSHHTCIEATLFRAPPSTPDAYARVACYPLCLSMFTFGNGGNRGSGVNVAWYIFTNTCALKPHNNEWKGTNKFHLLQWYICYCQRKKLEEMSRMSQDIISAKGAANLCYSRQGHIWPLQIPCLQCIPLSRLLNIE